MIPVDIVISVSLIYFGLLFAVAFYADRRRAKGQSLINNANIYSLSLAVYCTSWTFYGSVGRAATNGIDFLTIYLGPTLIAFSWWFLLRKIIRISKEQNIGSIADFISSRYGKSAILGALVTIFTVIGIMPYIALQLKAVSRTFDLLSDPLIGSTASVHYLPVPALYRRFLPNADLSFDTAFAAAVILAIFGILFGARHLDSSERHEGLVAAIAMESVVKIIAFVAAGIFITFGMFDGFVDIFQNFIQRFPERADLLLIGPEANGYAHWFTMIFVSMMAVMFLPRQFHIMVVENCSEEHIRRAMWSFPAYMFVLNLFVIPIALAGLLMFNGDTYNADFFVMILPLQEGQLWLAMLVFIGGFSASAGMVMVSSVALSTMILNHLLMPIILKIHTEARDLSRLLINLKRLCIVIVILLGYFYYHFIGESAALVNIGLISFVAASQFAPALIGGLYWRRGTFRGATTGLVLGFVTWFFTLMVPSFVESGWLSSSIMEQGLFGQSLLRPNELFGLTGFDVWSHALFWTMLLNIGSYIAVSLVTKPLPAEIDQIANFVDVYEKPKEPKQRTRLTKAPTIMEFVNMMTKFIGEKQAHAAISNYLGDREIDGEGRLSEQELIKLKRFTELTLAGSVGAAPARIIIDNYLTARGSRMESVFDVFGSVTISRTASREQLSVLYDAAHAVASGGTLKEILDEILKIFTDQFKFDLCVIRILDEDRQTLTVRSQRGMSSEHYGESERNLTTDTFIGETFLTNSVTVVNDTDNMSKPASAKIIHDHGITSFAHAPISVEGETIGVLSAFSRTAKGIFTQEFIELFTSLAGQVGVAWRNAKQTEHVITLREQQRELEIAKNIQLGLLPKRIPDIPGVALAGICVPAKDVGGDYYDFLHHDDGKLDLLIADVSGHNVGAALIMAETRTFIQSRSEHLGAPANILKALNQFFYDDLTQAELFVTMFYLQFQPDKHRAKFASAGHSPPLLWKGADKSLERLDVEGLIIGVYKDFPYQQAEISLEPGDCLLMYTDGVIEAENAEGEFFGEDRLGQLLLTSNELSPQDLIDHIFDQVRLFTGQHSFLDDVSLVVMKLSEAEASSE